MSETFTKEMIDASVMAGRNAERERIIKLLVDLNAIRRCAATGEFVAFDTYGEKVIYLTGLESK